MPRHGSCRERGRRWIERFDDEEATGRPRIGKPVGASAELSTCDVDADSPTSHMRCHRAAIRLDAQAGCLAQSNRGALAQFGVGSNTTA